ncbi:MBL fold metallo-hydrolase [Pseudoduganella lutea]|uniref:MBL fold metallo-hydrolase n=1 Tax=Pseudoduganella lutea TaxID=321985 RepID=A0A4P6L512_9BURK|nr:MBL fold metallo-hydrolase [Pseudoduganella lutea]
MAAIFSLEALDAAEGDALILHYGSSAAPRHLLIDGGPRATWQRALRPRLAQIAERLEQWPLELRHILVSHLDSDHIGGVLALAESLGAEDCPAQCDRFWLNTFDEALLAHLPQPAMAALAALDGGPRPASLGPSKQASGRGRTCWHRSSACAPRAMAARHRWWRTAARRCCRSTWGCSTCSSFARTWRTCASCPSSGSARRSRTKPPPPPTSTGPCSTCRASCSW